MTFNNTRTLLEYLIQRQIEVFSADSKHSGSSQPRSTQTDPANDLSLWQSRLNKIAEQWGLSADQAVVAGFNAPCIAFAFAGGYQAALSRLLANAHSHSLTASATPASGFYSLCITEKEGNRPRNIATTLAKADQDWVLNGHKTYVTGGTSADRLIIAATTGLSAQGLPSITMVNIPATRAGINVESLPTLPFIPELPHATVKFDNVKIAPEEILEGDGYLQCVKPFRTIEDLHVELALIGLMIRHTPPTHQNRAAIEKLFALMGSLKQLVDMPSLDEATHLLLAGHRHFLLSIVEQLESEWEQNSPAFYAQWQRDRKLLSIAQSARDARTEKAWSVLGIAQE